MKGSADWGAREGLGHFPLQYLLKGGEVHSTSSAGRAMGQWAPAPPLSSPALPPHSLGLQPGLRERGHDPGAPSAPGGGDAGADVWPPAHDPVRLPAQPGPRGPRQGALLRLLTAGPGLLARLSRTHTRPACARPPCPPVTSLPYITRLGPRLSLASLCLGGHPAGLAPEGPLWGQGSVNKWATTGPPSGQVPVWSSPVLTSDVQPQTLSLPHPKPPPTIVWKSM